MLRFTSEEDMLRFFFQAEGGIRDLTVTGVQTCALPISAGAAWGSSGAAAATARRAGASACGPVPLLSPPVTARTRSEERRVGKECRSRWVPRPLIQKSRTLASRVASAQH